MASTIVEISLPSGLTGCLLKLFERGADSLLNTGGDTLTEETNAKGLYTATVTEALSGNKRAIAYLDDGVTPLRSGAVYLQDDTARYYVVDEALLIGPQAYDNTGQTSELPAAGGGSVFAGDGDIPVDHDTGGEDNLRVMSDGEPVDNAIVRIYLRSEWDADRTTAERRGNWITDDQGRAVEPAMLNAGEYAFVAEKPGVMATQTLYATVS